MGIVLLAIPSIHSEPSFNSGPGCSGSGCHSFSDGKVSVTYLGNNQVEVTVSGTTSRVAGELVDESGTVVSVINTTSSNPFILTAPGDGSYTINAGYKNPSRIWDSASVVISTPLQLPSAPSLVAPLDLAVFDSTTILFVWQNSQPEVTNYWIEYDTTDQFLTSQIDSSLTDTTFLSSDFANNSTIWWRVKAFNSSGWGDFSEVRSFSIEVPTSVEKGLESPKDFSLLQNYPNPFNPSTVIKYSIPLASFVTLKIYDAIGNEISTLVNQIKGAGSYEVNFNAEQLSSGIYYYKLQAGSFIETRKMILLK